MRGLMGSILVVLLFACSGKGGAKPDAADTGSDADTDTDADADSDADTDADTDTYDWGETVPCPVEPGFKEVCVPGGRYLMGCMPGDIQCEDNEHPMVEVTLSPFFVDSEEATCVDTIAFLNTLREGFNRLESAVYRVDEDAPENNGRVWASGGRTPIRLNEDGDYAWIAVPLPEEEDWYDPSGICPYREVDAVCGGFSWLGASLFCEWKGKRLPTEAQWEAAARGQSFNVRPCPHLPVCITDWISCCDSSASECYFDSCGRCDIPTSTDSLACDQPFGAKGFAGNASEWVADGLDGDHSWCAGGCTDPEPRPGEKKVLKGGNLCWRIRDARISARLFSWQNNKNTGNSFTGARCVRPAVEDTDTDTQTAIPSNACITGDQDRQGCAEARIIGRGEASRSGWFVLDNQNTCDSGDHHQGDCQGQVSDGPDHTYAIWARAGEVVVAHLGFRPGFCAVGDGGLPAPRLRLLFNESDYPEGATSCPETVGCRVSEPYLDLSHVHHATADGWYFFVVDGGSADHGRHRGYYHLKVGLSNCEEQDCGC